jgi:hypothetical protein
LCRICFANPKILALYPKRNDRQAKIDQELNAIRKQPLGPPFLCVHCPKRVCPRPMMLCDECQAWLNERVGTMPANVRQEFSDHQQREISDVLESDE